MLFKEKKILPIIFVIYFFFLSGANSEVKNSWKNINENLEILTIKDNSNAFFNGELILFRTNLKNYKLEVVKSTQTGKKIANVKYLANKLGADLVINANFFDENYEPIGLVITNGRETKKLHKGGKTLNGIVELGRKSINIKNRRTPLLLDTLWAVQAGPLLVLNNRVLNSFNKKNKQARRSGVCITPNNNLIIYISSGLRGFTLNETAQILVDKKVNCSRALNLDGGGSSQIFVKNESNKNINNGENIFIPGQEEIPVALALFQR